MSSSPMPLLLLLLLPRARASPYASCCGNLACLSPALQLLDVLSVGNFSCGPNPALSHALFAGAAFRLTVLPGPGVAPFVASGPSWFAVLRNLTYDFRRTEMPPFLLVACEMRLPVCDSVTSSVGRPLSPAARLFRRTVAPGLGQRPLVEVFLGGSNHPPVFAAADPRHLFAATSFRLRLALALLATLLYPGVLVLNMLMSLKRKNKELQTRQALQIQAVIRASEHRPSPNTTALKSPTTEQRFRVEAHSPREEKKKKKCEPISGETSEVLPTDLSASKDQSGEMKLTDEYESFLSLETATDTEKDSAIWQGNNAMAAIANPSPALLRTTLEEDAMSVTPPLPPLPPPSLPTSLASSSMTIKLDASTPEAEARSKSLPPVYSEKSSKDSVLSPFACETMITSNTSASEATLVTDALMSENVTTATAIPPDVSIKPSTGLASMTLNQNEQSSGISRRSVTASTDRSRRGKTGKLTSATTKSMEALLEETNSKGKLGNVENSRKIKSRGVTSEDDKSDSKKSKRLRLDSEKSPAIMSGAGRSEKDKSKESKSNGEKPEVRESNENNSRCKKSEQSKVYKEKEEVSKSDGERGDQTTSKADVSEESKSRSKEIDCLRTSGSWSDSKHVEAAKSVSVKLDKIRSVEEKREGCMSNEVRPQASKLDKAMSKKMEPDASDSDCKRTHGSRLECKTTKESESGWKTTDKSRSDSKTIGESWSESSAIGGSWSDSRTIGGSRSDCKKAETGKSDAGKSDEIRSVEDGGEGSRSHAIRPETSTLDEATSKRVKSAVIRAAIRAAASASMGAHRSRRSDLSSYTDPTLITVPWIETEATTSVASVDLGPCEELEDERKIQ